MLYNAANPGSKQGYRQDEMRYYIPLDISPPRLPLQYKDLLMVTSARGIFFGVGKFIGVARIFSGVHFFVKKVDDFFSRRPSKHMPKLLK